MYWNYFTTINYESVLSKKDVTLEEVMDNEGILQECNSQNKHLIDYLVRSDVLEKLVALTTEEPSGDENVTTKYKYPNIACELLTCEVPQLSESLANDEALLRKLYSFLDSDAPLNPLLASFFSKTLSVLITRKSEQNLYSYQFTCLKVLGFLKMKEDSISLLLKHLGTSAIMDLVFKLITRVECHEIKENILQWLDEQNLVQNIVALLDPSTDSNMHYNIAQLLCNVIITSRTHKLEDSKPNKILDRIESPEVVSLLLDHILKEPKCETSIVGGISVLLALLEDNGDYTFAFGEEETLSIKEDFLKVVASTIKAILPRLKDFHDILINPPLKPAVKTTITVLDPPLGNTRVEVAKLLSVLVASNNEEVNQKLIELDTLNVLWDLFFKYTWNNFLHTQVQKCLAFALNAECPTTEDREIPKNGLIAHMLSKCHLIQRILDAWQDNETQQTEHKRPRRGYMGHLTEIACKIALRAEKHSFGAFMKEILDNETFTKWESFVTYKLSKVYGFVTDSGKNCINDDNGGGKDGSFGNFSGGLYWNNCQVEGLSPKYTGKFFQGGQCDEDVDALNTSTNQNFQKINFNAYDKDADQQAVFFEEVCAQKFQTLDDYNEETWNQDITPSKTNSEAEKTWNMLENSSSDEEDEMIEKVEDLQKDDDLEFNTLSFWSGETAPGTPPVLENLNPWEPSKDNSVSSPDIGWANFDAAPCVPNFALNLTPDINTTIATSSAYDIGTIPLDLTPNENNGNIEDMFTTANTTTAGEKGVPLPEKSETADEVPESGNSSRAEAEGAEEKKATETIKSKPEEVEKTAAAATTTTTTTREETQVNCVEASKANEGVEDVNSVVKKSEEKELGNSRFLSPQGLTTNPEKEPESGDSYQLLNENVQAVPNERT